MRDILTVYCASAQGSKIAPPSKTVPSRIACKSQWFSVTAESRVSVSGRKSNRRIGLLTDRGVGSDLDTRKLPGNRRGTAIRPRRTPGDGSPRPVPAAKCPSPSIMRYEWTKVK